jgi:hypothetical protein
MPESKRAFRNFKTGQVLNAKLICAHVGAGTEDIYVPDTGGLPDLADWEAGWEIVNGEFIPGRGSPDDHQIEAAVLKAREESKGDGKVAELPPGYVHSPYGAR